MGRRSGFNLEEIDQALATAGVNDDARKKVKALLAGTRKPGRPLEPDDELLIRLAQHIDGLTPYGAATKVTQEMPEPPRKTIRDRIYKKYIAKPEHWQEMARQARMTKAEKDAESLAEARRELARLRRDW